MRPQYRDQLGPPTTGTGQLHQAPGLMPHLSDGSHSAQSPSHLFQDLRSHVDPGHLWTPSIAWVSSSSSSGQQGGSCLLHTAQVGAPGRALHGPSSWTKPSLSHEATGCWEHSRVCWRNGPEASAVLTQAADVQGWTAPSSPPFAQQHPESLLKHSQPWKEPLLLPRSSFRIHTLKAQ